MNAEIKDQTNRKAQIQMLEAGCARLTAQIVEHNCIGNNLVRKLIAREAELRCQKLYLRNAENAARWNASKSQQ